MTTSPSNQPRPEYPRPQFARSSWINLNGPWTYTFDFSRSGTQRDLAKSTGFDQVIQVPFCPESELSGVGHKDFIETMWYQRKLSIPENWAGQRIILHFGAVDYESEVFIDGQTVGRHYGGTSSFQYEITHWVKPGQDHNLVVYVHDDLRAGNQPSGKQSAEFQSYGCFYTRTTGIWQTVWMEAVPTFGLKRVTILSDLDGARFIITPEYYETKRGLSFRVTLYSGNEMVSQVSYSAVEGLPTAIPIPQPKTWSPESPFLYDLDLDVLDENGSVLDHVRSYAGLRKIHLEGGKVFLNNEPIFLRLVLDQGFYPDGIWTAPSDEALKRDILLSQKAGFNGARLHQKVFEERFHYWADQLGYLTWGKSSSWGLDVKEIASARNFLGEWHEIICRDRNHPSIIAWTPFNETWDTGNRRQHNRLHIDAYEMTHAIDPTRPVNDASGYAHARTDLWTVHTYEQSPAALKELLQLTDGQPWRNFPDREIEYDGQPYIVDEFGGIKWIPEDRRPFAENSWGYGEGPRTLDEFYARLKGQVNALYAYDHIAGYCYTQLTDVEQEQNGIYNYDRSLKFNIEKVARIFKGEE